MTVEKKIQFCVMPTSSDKYFLLIELCVEVGEGYKNVHICYATYPDMTEENLSFFNLKF